MMGYGGYGLFGGLGMGIGMIIWVAIIGLAIWALVALAGNRGTQRQESAIDILRRRYALGEINKAEFDQAKRDLA